MKSFWTKGINPRRGMRLLTVAAGVRDVIHKPNAVDELARTVGRVLAEVAAR